MLDSPEQDPFKILEGGMKIILDADNGFIEVD
jgi:hypothetical protein